MEIITPQASSTTGQHGSDEATPASASPPQSVSDSRPGGAQAAQPNRLTPMLSRALTRDVAGIHEASSVLLTLLTSADPLVHHAGDIDFILSWAEDWPVGCEVMIGQNLTLIEQAVVGHSDTAWILDDLQCSALDKSIRAPHLHDQHFCKRLDDLCVYVDDPDEEFLLELVDSTGSLLASSLMAARAIERLEETYGCAKPLHPVFGGLSRMVILEHLAISRAEHLTLDAKTLVDTEAGMATDYRLDLLLSCWSPAS